DEGESARKSPASVGQDLDVAVETCNPILGVILFTNPFFSAFSLELVLVCISLFYILANSQFVASAQLLIYVGAINVLIIFAVMFINGLEYDKNFRLWTLGDGITLLVCTSIFVFIIITILNTSWYGIIWTKNHQLKGNIFSIFVIAIAAAEAAIVPDIVSAIYRNKKST
ncbi:hypothetical protein V2J09_017741, partial [Rumex salicifolius]